MKTDKILIPVEIKQRELSAKLLLSTVLAGRGYCVYIGNKIQHTALGRIDPDVYFEIGAKGKSTRLQRLKENGVKTVILDTEGSAFPGRDAFADMMDEKTLNFTDCYLAWGKIAKEVVNEESPGTCVEITGNPRFDLLQKPHRSFYQSKAKNLSDEYGNYILFNGNFPLPNGIKTPEEKSKHWDEYNSSWQRLMRLLRKQSKIFPEFIRCIAETAEYFPERKVVVRPHPNENPNFYKNIFYGHENIYIKTHLEARPWIMGASAVVHNSCTTGVTAALLDTPVIAYTPDGLEATSTPNDISDRCQSINETCELIDDYINGNKSFTLDTSTKSKLRNHIDNIDYLSSERIADVIDKMVSDTSNKKTTSADSRLRIRQSLTRIIGPKRFEELWIKSVRGENRNKFPYCETTEIKSIVDQFDDEIKPDELEIDRIPYVVNGFRLRSK